MFVTYHNFSINIQFASNQLADVILKWGTKIAEAVLKKLFFWFGTYCHYDNSLYCIIKKVLMLSFRIKSYIELRLHKIILLLEGTTLVLLYLNFRSIWCCDETISPPPRPSVNYFRFWFSFQSETFSLWFYSFTLYIKVRTGCRSRENTIVKYNSKVCTFWFVSFRKVSIIQELWMFEPTTKSRLKKNNLSFCFLNRHFQAIL